MQESQNRFSSTNHKQSYSSHVTTYDGRDEGNHPLFRKDLFLLKILASALLFVGVAALYRYPSEKLHTAKEFVTQTFEKELQFAAVTDWYEKTFGKPIAFLPSETKKEKQGVQSVSSQYIEPVSGSIVQSFQENGKGVVLETELNLKVKAIQDGVVEQAGVNEETGNTVVIQHSDGSKSWYGDLENIDVKVYEKISKGATLGSVSSMHDTSKGRLFFGLMKDETFVDPKQVMSFE